MTQKTESPIILAAGGTGGHIFPAEALAEALLERGEAVELMTDKRFRGYYGDTAQSAFAHLPIHCIHAGNLGGGLLRKLRGGFDILLGIKQARSRLKELKPKAVVGFGGYPSFPTMVAAASLRIPTIIHEQNAILGRANSKLVDRVNRIATSYPETQKIPSHAQAKTILTGNPVRAGIRALHGVPYAPPQTDGVLRLLVTGGSQGAHIFSDVLPEAIGRLPEELRQRLRIDQQCREADVDRTRAAYRALGMQADIATFFNDMPSRLAGAHLVIARAGASTVAELSCAGRPAILVPLPTAMDNHQYVNAQAIEDAEAGWVMAQNAFTPEAISARLEQFLTLPSSLANAAEAMRALGRVEAAEELAKLVRDLV
jgi:UDP-N-acetylglucosamine--N-acetylmuramyl-(pentapeptide) pyrophosphoryl-undecaprenol N-acetylglucosamine transferase